MFQKLSQNRDKYFPLLKGKWHTKEFKEKILPNLKNSNVNKLSYTMWFFFHPSAYKLFYYGSPLVFIVFMLPAFVLGIIRTNWWLVIIFGLFIFSTVYSLINKIKNKGMYPKDYTFYDNWIKRPEDDFVEV